MVRFETMEKQRSSLTPDAAATVRKEAVPSPFVEPKAQANGEGESPVRCGDAD
jgi:hypothetical protein